MSDVSYICGFFPQVSYPVCNLNVGGIQRIWIEDVRKIQPAFSIDTGQFAGVFTDNRNKVSSIVAQMGRYPLIWIELPTIQGVSSGSAPFVRDTAGARFDLMLDLVAPHNEALKLFVFSRLWRYPLMCMFQDANDHYWIGGIEQGLQILTGNQDLGIYPQGANSFKVQLTGRQKNGWLEVPKVVFDAQSFCENCDCVNYVGQPGDLFDLTDWQWCLLELLKNNDLS